MLGSSFISGPLEKGALRKESFPCKLFQHFDCFFYIVGIFFSFAEKIIVSKLYISKLCLSHFYENTCLKNTSFSKFLLYFVCFLPSSTNISCFFYTCIPSWTRVRKLSLNLCLRNSFQSTFFWVETKRCHCLGTSFFTRVRSRPPLPLPRPSPSPFPLRPSPSHFPLRPSPFTLHPSPFTLRPSPFAVRRSPSPHPPAFTSPCFSLPGLSLSLRPSSPPASHPRWKKCSRQKMTTFGFSTLENDCLFLPKVENILFYATLRIYCSTFLFVVDFVIVLLVVVIYINQVYYMIVLH